MSVEGSGSSLEHPTEPAGGPLHGMVAIVTGSSRGIGEAIAAGFASAGARVVLAARTAADLDRVAERCRQAGSTGVLAVPTDVGDETQVMGLVQRSVDEFGRLDVFVANAGTAAPALSRVPMRRLESYDAHVAAEILRVNTLGVWLCLKAALPRLGAGGSFIALGSDLGRAGRAGTGLLAVSKAGVDTLVSIAAAEQADAGVRINLLSPGGMVDTNLYGPDKMPAALAARVPVMPAEAVVPAAVWLACAASSGITGARVSAASFNASTPEQYRAQLAAESPQAVARRSTR